MNSLTRNSENAHKQTATVVLFAYLPRLLVLCWCRRELSAERREKQTLGGAHHRLRPPTMAPHENLFHVEKHYNDTLYKGQRHGTSHTDKEIQAAANLLGRDSVVADERTALRNVKVSLFVDYLSIYLRTGNQYDVPCVLLTGATRG